MIGLLRDYYSWHGWRALVVTLGWVFLVAGWAGAAVALAWYRAEPVTTQAVRAVLTASVGFVLAAACLEWVRLKAEDFLSCAEALILGVGFSGLALVLPSFGAFAVLLFAPVAPPMSGQEPHFLPLLADARMSIWIVQAVAVAAGRYAFGWVFHDLGKTLFQLAAVVLVVSVMATVVWLVGRWTGLHEKAWVSSEFFECAWIFFAIGTQIEAPADRWRTKGHRMWAAGPGEAAWRNAWGLLAPTKTACAETVTPAPDSAAPPLTAKTAVALAAGWLAPVPAAWWAYTLATRHYRPDAADLLPAAGALAVGLLAARLLLAVAREVSGDARSGGALALALRVLAWALVAVAAVTALWAGVTIVAGGMEMTNALAAMLLVAGLLLLRWALAGADGARVRSRLATGARFAPWFCVMGLVARAADVGLRYDHLGRAAMVFAIFLLAALLLEPDKKSG